MNYILNIIHEDTVQCSTADNIFALSAYLFIIQKVSNPVVIFFVNKADTLRKLVQEISHFSLARSEKTYPIITAARFIRAHQTLHSFLDKYEQLIIGRESPTRHPPPPSPLCATNIHLY